MRPQTSSRMGLGKGLPPGRRGSRLVRAAAPSVRGSHLLRPAGIGGLAAPTVTA